MAIRSFMSETIFALAFEKGRRFCREVRAASTSLSDLFAKLLPGYGIAHVPVKVSCIEALKMPQALLALFIGPAGLSI